MGRNQQAIQARAGQFKADEKARDAIVKAKEAAGDYLEAMPEYKQLLQELKDRLLVNQRARMKTNLRQVADPGTEKAYSVLLDALSNKRVAISAEEAAKATEAGLKVVQGTNPATGEPQSYRVFTNSFDALDDVRRKLGTVFSKKPAEGYEGIGADIAKKYYGQISDIQKKFGGEPQERLLRHYADSTEGLEMFRSKTGRLATAVDKYNDTEFATNAGLLPRRYFSSPEGVKQLVELTGDKALVTQAAKEYAVNALTGKSESQVRTWMTQNREFLKVLPEVGFAIDKYASELARGERVFKNTTNARRLVESSITDKIRAGETTAARIRTEATGQARDITRTGEQTASTLLGDKFPVERVRQLIESGSVAQWEAAGPAIASNPQAKASVADAVKQVLADRSERSTKGIVDFFSRNVRPAVENAGLMTSAQADGIAAKLTAIEALKVPESQKLGLAKRLLLQSVSGYAATIGGRATGSLVEMIPQ